MKYYNSEIIWIPTCEIKYILRGKGKLLYQKWTIKEMTCPKISEWRLVETCFNKEELI